MADINALAGFEDAIASTGARVVRHRLATSEAMTPFLQSAYGSFGRDTARWVYDSNWAQSEATQEELSESLAAALASARHRDMERRLTTIGPQRDEPRLFLDDRDARTHASQGEQRSLVLALRLATFDLLADEFDDPPVLLLDDVFSELDARRAAAVIERLPGAQAFLSSARTDDVGRIEGMSWDVDPAGKVTAL